MVGEPRESASICAPERRFSEGVSNDAERGDAVEAACVISVGVVVIGRNEGERLVRCLESLSQIRQGSVIYVDSGSTDGSREAAAAAGAVVTPLDMTRPFTAARARNAGVATHERLGGVTFVQFIDGDCELHPDWIGQAVAALEADPSVAVVCGRRRERHPEASVYNRLCDIEWDTPVGLAAACGGDSMMRLSAFRSVGGFDETLIAGEEPDLCLRLRRAGWRVRRLAAEMTLHDAAITRLEQWIKRSRRSGWAYAEGAWRHGRGAERYNVPEVRRILFWAGALPAAILMCGLGMILSAAAGAFYWTGPAAAATAMLSLYPLSIIRIAVRRRAKGDTVRDSAIYGLFMMLSKFPEISGVIRYHLSRRSADAPELIEYK